AYIQPHCFLRNNDLLKDGGHGHKNCLCFRSASLSDSALITAQAQSIKTAMWLAPHSKPSVAFRSVVESMSELLEPTRDFIIERQEDLAREIVERQWQLRPALE